MRGTIRPLLLAVLMTAAGACASAPRTAPAPIAISDVKVLAGRWEGLAHGLSDKRTDYLEVTIKEDGTYETVIHREIGVFRGRGQIALVEGKLRWQGDKAQGFFWLTHDRGGRRGLSFEGEIEPGRPLWGDLLPAQR